MPEQQVLMKVSKTWDDEFDVEGFMLFASQAKADAFAQGVCKASRGDNEWMCFGNNQCIGNFDEGDFEFTPLYEEEAQALTKLFHSIHHNQVVYGIVTDMLNAYNDPDEEDDDA